MDVRGEVRGYDPETRRMIVHTPWGYTVASLVAGDVDVGAELAGVLNELGPQRWHIAERSADIDVDVLTSATDDAAARKLFVGN